MDRYSGIVHNAGRTDGTKVYLPLEEVRVHALLLDVSAKVTIDQVYSNPSDTATSRAKYLFPVPASAAICAFEARKSDGTVIVSKCMDKDLAAERHERAIRDGKFTGLLETVTDDVFTISVGSIPAQERIEVKVVYVMTLLNDDNVDEIRFQLPQHVGDRYGTPPAALNDAAGTSTSTRIRISIDIQTSGRLHSVISPSHGHDIKEKRYPTHRNRTSRRRTTVTYRSKMYLSKDFLLIIHAEGLGAPRCFVEVARKTSRLGSDTIAFHLTMVPKSMLPPLPCQEYLFLIDRSGSMTGNRVETAKETLVTLLKLLPAQGTQFNLYSFGSTVRRSYPQSLTYDQATMTTAVTEVRGMDASFGGTEIRSALKEVFQTRNRTMPTAVFVLTDGEVHNTQIVIQDVGDAVHAATTQAPLRVFTLGIGDGVSSALCEGIARAGNGVCLFATHNEDIYGRCARLFQAGRTQFIEDVTVDWGIPPEGLRSPTVKFASDDLKGMVQLRAPPTLQQSPPTIENLHAGTRISITAILTVESISIPDTVRIEGRLSDTGEPFEMVVPVRVAQIADADPGQPPIHTLAARKLVQDHIEGRAPLPLSETPGVPHDALRKAAIIRLGEKYHIASRYTSFVAVQDGDVDKFEQPIRTKGFPQTSHRHNTTVNAAAHIPTGDLQPKRTITSIFSDMFRRWSFIPLSLLSAGQGISPDQPPQHQNEDGHGDHDDGYESYQTFSTMSSLESRSDWISSDWSESRPSTPPPLSEADKRMQRSPSPAFDASTQVQPPPASAPVPPTSQLKTEVVNLIHVQSFDGSFSSEQLRQIVGEEAVNDARGQGVEPVVWATALAAAFLKKHAFGHTELWTKPLEFLRRYSGSEHILARAIEALG
ncbi:hypothetical protein PC9H_004059 [Pleurotus ostreatus]|uniref:Uncharacterized protein n=2 Tax=Pleurotus ostreatus TaxID=5322 RepID=A0A8H7A0A0_PLEOS|nr:uncharacterized protein PC9H_004059 [Pleurotus ostreatus]KAF7437223.1 hypothetical protein PC9H_004059 [Pleurotus ostreatus]KAJ8703108.1 hypothetical protein PTI98_001758 [Pleurotus ostreatus]